MALPPAKDLTPLERELVDAFLRREPRFFLTGGAALVGYYFHHRSTDDLDFFTAEPISLQGPTEALGDAGGELKATFEPRTEYAEKEIGFAQASRRIR